MPMRLCGKCAKPVFDGGTMHPGCRTARPYDDPLHRAMGAMFRATGRRCADCGTRHTRANPIEAHHIVPVEAGGANVPSNYQPLCRRCNASQGSRQGTE